MLRLFCHKICLLPVQCIAWYTRWNFYFVQINLTAWNHTFYIISKCEAKVFNLRAVVTELVSDYWHFTVHMYSFLHAWPRGILEWGNVWVFVQLIFGPHWNLNQLNKNPNIALLQDSWYLCAWLEHKSTHAHQVSGVGTRNCQITSTQYFLSLRLDLISGGHTSWESHPTSLQAYDLDVMTLILQEKI